MRDGIHIEQQKSIVKFARRANRSQSVAALCILGALVLVGVAFRWQRVGPAAPPVAMVQGATASGSGVLISSTLLVTSAHVIGTQGAVQVTFADNSALTAQVVFADSTSDVAVLQLGSPDSTLVPLPIGETEGLDNGARVTAVGYPGGRMSKLATQLTSKTATQLLTTGAADPGISGGALLSDDEHLIGVIGATRELGWRSDPGHIWAIPMQVVRKVCRDHGVPLE